MHFGQSDGGYLASNIIIDVEVRVSALVWTMVRLGEMETESRALMTRINGMYRLSRRPWTAI